MQVSLRCLLCTRGDRVIYSDHPQISLILETNGNQVNPLAAFFTGDISKTQLPFSS